MCTSIFRASFYMPLICFSMAVAAQSPLSNEENYKEAVARRFSECLQIKTISNEDPADFDSAAFLKLRILLEKSFPLVHSRLERISLNHFAYIYKWQGTNTALAPHVLLAHQDVVPVEDAALKSWTFPPFSGTISNDTIWGRGAVDNKCTMMAILEAAENLLHQNVTPLRTVYFCFGHDEETSGQFGGRSIAAWFAEKKIRPAMVLDEGLEIIYKNYIPLKTPVALIGVGEKGYATFEITAGIPGGHSAAPENETAIDILTAALKRLHDNPMPAKLTYPVTEFLKTIKHQLPGKMRFAISNLWLFKKKLLKQMSKNNGTNSLIRTTMAVTMLSSGVKDNVIPSFAKATINCRIMPGETVDDAEKHIQKHISDDRITVKRTAYCWNPPLQTRLNSSSYKKIDSLIKALMPGVETAPLMVVGTTDARFFREVSDGVINFLPVTDSKGMHGIDERRSLSAYIMLIRFLERLMISE